jgi:polyhydroxybutyrate depolymerase
LAAIRPKRKAVICGGNKSLESYVSHQGKLRTYYLYTPKSYNQNRPMPLVLVFHGSNGTGHSIADVTRFNDLAEKKGFIVVYPDGIISLPQLGLFALLDRCSRTSLQ